jgi:hypothetical protein
LVDVRYLRRRQHRGQSVGVGVDIRQQGYLHVSLRGFSLARP